MTDLFLVAALMFAPIALAAVICKAAEKFADWRKSRNAERWNHRACCGMCDNCPWTECPSAK